MATTNALLIYLRPSAGTAMTLKQTIYPPSFDIVPAIFRSARFSRNPSTPLNIHAVLNSTKPAKRGAARKAWVCTFGVVAGPSQAKLTEEEKATAKIEEEKGKEKETSSDPQEDVGKWDVLIKREVAGKPVTVFDVRYVLYQLSVLVLLMKFKVLMGDLSHMDALISRSGFSIPKRWR